MVTGVGGIMGKKGRGKQRNMNRGRMDMDNEEGIDRESGGCLLYTSDAADEERLV